MSDSEFDSRIRNQSPLHTASTPSGLKQDIVEELKGFFNRKFTELKRDFREDSEWAAESVRKKVRSDNLLSFKSLSNRKQFQINSEVSDLLDSAQKAIDLRNASKASDYITEAKNKIKHRSKLIRIADSSPAGWVTIQEYEQNEVASDSDDDKKIRRAEERAKTKLEKSRKAESWNNNGSSSDNSSNQSFRSFRRDFTRSTMAGQQRAPTNRGNREIVCYACGGLGHFATGCAAHLKTPDVGRALGLGSSGRSAVATTNNPSCKPDQKDK